MIKNNKITILDNIIIDKNLNKYKQNPLKEYNDGTNDGTIDLSSVINRAAISEVVDTNTEDYIDYILMYEHRFINRIILKLYNVYVKLTRNRRKQSEIKVKELLLFFNKIKNNIKTLDKDVIDKISSNYISALNSAEENNQISLKETILSISERVKLEAILCSSKFNRYITEEDVVEFYNKASKHDKLKTNLKLTYIKNFIKTIPKEVSDLRKDAEQLCVFDNYVIMHYDYNNDSTKDTKEEIEKKKDPILFGIISGSRKLYYIGDWIDDYCDLTLEKFIETIGHDVNKISEFDFPNK